MMKQYNVVIPLSVKQDISEIVSFYFAQRSEYALHIFDRLKRRIQFLKEFPESGRIVPELKNNNVFEYRELIESYWRIIYRIENDEVILLAVIDGRRDIEDILIEKLTRTVR